MNMQLIGQNFNRGPIWTTTSLQGDKMKLAATAIAPASTAWPSANLAILIPFEVGQPVRMVEMFFTAGTSPGTSTYDLGIYDENFNRLASIGSTAATNNTDFMLPIGGGVLSPPVTLNRGRYYMAMSAAAITLTVRANNYVNQFNRFIGMQKATLGSVVLPATITPESMGATTILPLVGMATITNIL